MHVSLCAIALALMYASAAVAQPVAPRSGTYNLDPRHASVTFSVGHMGLSRTVGRFNTIDATLTLDAAAPERSRLIATIEAVSVDTGLPSFDDFLRGSRFLNAANNPQIRFEARRIERTGGSSARVIGNLTLHGVTREQSLDVVFNAARESLIDGRFMTGFSATASVLRSAFGLDLFAELVSDEVRIEIEAEFALTPG